MNDREHIHVSLLRDAGRLFRTQYPSTIALGKLEHTLGEEENSISSPELNPRRFDLLGRPWPSWPVLVGDFVIARTAVVACRNASDATR